MNQSVELARLFNIGLHQGFYIICCALARLRAILVISWPEERACCAGIVAFFVTLFMVVLCVGAVLGAVVAG